VLNPSFEIYNKCPWLIGRFSSNVKDWSIPNLGTTDFFSFCSETVGYNNYNGFQNPKEGKTYAGFYLFSRDNYREYIQGKLSKNLEAGKAYQIKFYISLADRSTHALNCISILMSEEILGFNNRAKPKENASVLTNKKTKYQNFKHISESYIKPKKYTKKAFQLYDIESDSFYNNREEWVELSYQFIANGSETHFSIGNFKSNKNSDVQEILKTTKTKHQFSYYYIDNVSIEPVEKEELKKIEETIEKLIIKTNEVYTFKNVLFDFDKAELLKVSISELDELYKHLKEDSNLNIEIYGHTDNVGLDARNKELSEQRAKAVADYLISQGLDKSKIKSFGFGSTKPISDNKTEEGRQLNRRV
jgi:outer membrane protein OmpA-like peptidoglycan-associated protein